MATRAIDVRTKAWAPARTGVLRRLARWWWQGWVAYVRDAGLRGGR